MNEPLYSRYVALGDSQTEGLGDGDDETGLRGWADRLAEHLAALNPGLTYANLAIRGRHAHEIRAEQLEPALALRPDVATVVAGMNDLLRPKFDPDAVAADIDAMFAALTTAGAKVATVTFPDLGRIVPLARPLRARVLELNERIRQAARSHGVAVLEAFEHPVTCDPRLWSSDRLHASPLGHTRIAEGMAFALGLPGSSIAWADPLPAVPRANPLGVARAELAWLAGFFGPWIVRRLRGQSSGDGRSAKRPGLAPVSGGETGPSTG